MWVLWEAYIDWLEHHCSKLGETAGAIVLALVGLLSVSPIFIAVVLWQCRAIICATLIVLGSLKLFGVI